MFWVLHFRFNKLITSVEVIVADRCTFLQQISLVKKNPSLRSTIQRLDVNRSHSHERIKATTKIPKHFQVYTWSITQKLNRTNEEKNK